MALILGPILFYLPKFFEVTTAMHKLPHTFEFDCSRIKKFDLTSTYAEAIRIARSHFIVGVAIMNKASFCRQGLPKDILEELMALELACGRNPSVYENAQAAKRFQVVQEHVETTGKRGCVILEK